MKLYAKSAIWSVVITVVATVATVVDLPPALKLLSLPTFPAFLLAFFLELGPRTEGMPKPTNIAVYILTFAVWWLIIYVAVRRWHGRRRTF